MRLRKREKQPSFGRSVFISTIIHVIVISIVIIFPPGSFIHPKPPLNITWIELPKGTGEDVYGLKDVKKLPESTIQEQEKEIEKALKPLPKEKEKEVMPEPKPKPIRKSVTVSKKAPTKGRRKKSGMNQALAKIDKRLKSRRESAQVPSSGEGYKYGTSDKPNRVPIDDPEYLKYQAMVRARIMRQWVVPGALVQIPSAKRPTVRIIVLISKSGEVITQRWSKKSGIESFNASAMRAIDRASPFPIPPERLKWEAFNEGFLVEFSAR